MTDPQSPNVSDLEQLSGFARLALAGIQREYPNAPGQVLNNSRDLLSPSRLHPAFFGCFDWHSSVHGHWMLVHLLRQFPTLPEATSIRTALGNNLTSPNLLVEAAYFDQPNHASFERSYGWAWLLKLAQELHTWQDVDGQTWSHNLQPLVERIITSYLSFFPRQSHPIRTGTHPNTAFGLGFALDYARQCLHHDLEEMILKCSLEYFAKDRDIPAAWEPGGNDFLSPSLVEADLMSRVLPPEDYEAWFEAFLPGITRHEPKSLLTPVLVSDRDDLQLVHLDGLNLSRAWCMYRISAALPARSPSCRVLSIAAKQHAHEGSSHVLTGNYAGEHWLASFAVYLLSIMRSSGNSQ